MIFRLRTFRVTAFLLFLTLSVETVAQSPAPSAQSDRFEKKLTARGTGKGIKVTETDGTEIKGVLVSLDATGFQVTPEKATAPVRIEYVQVKKISNTGLNTASKIGIGVAIGVVVFVAVILILLKANGF